MTAQSIACGACAADVPYGRLSCPSCGELLASVAGGRRGSKAAARRTAITDVLYDMPSAVSTTPVVDGQLSLDAATHDGTNGTDHTTADPGPDMQRAGSTPRNDAPDVTSDDAAAVETDAGLGSMVTPPWQVGAAGPSGGPTPAYLPRSAVPQPDPGAAAFVEPGAYVPPLPIATASAGPAAPARAWAGHSAEAIVTGVATQSGTQARTAEDPAAHAKLEFVRWLSVAGAAFAAVGFLLPWGLVVIGSNDSGYFGRWGLAGPWHAVVAGAVLVLLALSLVQNPIPAWIRSGLAGLGVGALLLGLVWPYLALPALGTGPGALIAAVGAAGLAVSGLLALITDRHVEGVRTV
jgi:hypothetical protein